MGAFIGIMASVVMAASGTCTTDSDCEARYGSGGYGTQGTHVAWIVDDEGGVHYNCYDRGATVCEDGTVFDDWDADGPKVQHRAPDHN